MSEQNETEAVNYSWGRKAAAYGVHTLTGGGVVCSFFAAISIFQSNYKNAYLFLALAFAIDAIDGTFARKAEVKKVLPYMNGDKLDDIIDYMNYTFLPILLIWHAGWLPSPAEYWLAIPLIVSLFAFINEKAKDDGFFLGFPSYWNLVAFYIDVAFRFHGKYYSLAIVLFFSILTVMPIRFVYPSRSRYLQKTFIILGLVWGVSFFYVVLAQYQQGAKQGTWTALLSFSYPAFYLVGSFFIDRYDKKKKQKSKA